MTPDDFKCWRKSMNLTQAEAANKIGISRAQLQRYERSGDASVFIPRTVALACSAVSTGILPYGEK